MPCRRFLWFGLVVEAMKPLVGILHGFNYFAECLDSAGNGIYEDVLAHYNWLRSQDNFAQQVAYDLERINREN